MIIKNDDKIKIVDIFKNGLILKNENTGEKDLIIIKDFKSPVWFKVNDVLIIEKHHNGFLLKSEEIKKGLFLEV
jgi:hypothetical protein